LQALKNTTILDEIFTQQALSKHNTLVTRQLKYRWKMHSHIYNIGL